MKVEVNTLSQILNTSGLKIPAYQRPYRWKEKNVIQLLDDIRDSIRWKRSRYRIGTIIIHTEDNSLNIVDGQQRLVTITLIFHFLKQENLSLLKSVVNHKDTRQNITANYLTIEKWFKNLSGKEKSEFHEYALYNCEFVMIEIDDLSEAFQLFDSQNARGKALEPYDLLKAFHLREMFASSQEEKLICVKAWESSVDSGLLKPILAEYLFRIRKWAKGEMAEYFTKDNIEVFKGVNLSKNKTFPYLRPYLINDSTVEEIQANKINQALDLIINYPFQITQVIINGKRFFEYVNFYARLYAELFINKNTPFLRFYRENCKYEGSGRAGDVYVRQLFEALIIYYVDKFGESDFEQLYKLFYRYAYKLRLKQSSVRYSSIDKYLKGGNAFKLIESAYHPNEIKEGKINPFIEQNEIKREIPQVQKQFNL